MLHRHFAARRLAGWVVLGLGGAVVELGLLRVLYEGLGLALPLATAAAAEVLILAKFAIADRWVFGHAWPTRERALRYHGACIGAFAVYWLVINALSTFLNVPYEVGFVAGTVASFAWSLATNFLWVWGQPKVS
jgi:putative flippase GtrA